MALKLSARTMASKCLLDELGSLSSFAFAQIIW